MHLNYFHYAGAIFLCAILISCQFKSEKTGWYETQWKENDWSISHESCIRLEIDPRTEDSLFASSIFSDLAFIKLETLPDNFIVFADNIIVHENKFFVLDANKSQSVNAFDHEGNSLFTLGPSGLHTIDDIPGFSKPDDLTFLPRQNELMVSDDTHRQILHYAMDGTVKQSFQHPYFIREYARLNANTQLYYLGGMENPRQYGDLEYQLMFTDNQHQIRSKHFPKKYQFEINKHFYPYKDSINFLNGYQDTIYRINSKEIRAAYALDFGAYKLPQNYLFDDLARFDEWSQKELVFLMTNITENDQALFFIFTFLREPKSVIYSKKTGRLLTGWEIFHDTYGNLFLNKPFVWGEKWIFAVNAKNFLEAYKEIKKQYNTASWKNFERENPEFVKIAEMTEPTDNPILVVADLKDF